MKYLVLRNCFTKECRYFRKGDIVELPDDIEKSEKNFKPVREALEPLPETPQSTTEPLKDNICSICGKECKSAFGLKSHMRAHK